MPLADCRDAKPTELTLTCSGCGATFTRKGYIHADSLRKGHRIFFCSLACTAREARRSRGIVEWTDDEKDFLREHSGRLTHAEIGRALGKTTQAVGVMISKLGLARIRRWTPEEDAFLRNHDDPEEIGTVAVRLDRSAGAVKLRRMKLGLARPKLTSDPLAEAKARQLYDRGCSDAEIAEHLGRNQSVITAWRHREGLPAHGWSPRAREKMSQARIRSGHSRRLGALRKLESRAAALAMGWPQARTPHEAKVLEILSRGPGTNEEIALALGTIHRSTDNAYHIIGLAKLLRRGLVLSEEQPDTPRYLYRLAPGVAKRPPDETIPARNEIDLTQYDRLVCKLALRYGAPRKDLRESEQYMDGWLGLTTARDRFRPELGYKFITIAFHYIKGYILTGRQTQRGRGRRGRRPVAVVAFSQIDGDPEEDDASDLAVSPEAKPTIDDADLCRNLLSRLDERTRRLIERVIMHGFTMEEAADMEDPPITPQRVQQIVAAGLTRMRELSVERR